MTKWNDLDPEQQQEILHRRTSDNPWRILTPFTRELFGYLDDSHPLAGDYNREAHRLSLAREYAIFNPEMPDD